MTSLVDSAAKHAAAFKRYLTRNQDTAQADALVDALAEAENRIMNLPVATAADMLVKVEFWAAHHLEHDSWTGEKLCADVRRLAGAA